MTRLYCPPGYLTSQDAIVRASLHWFPEEIAALNNTAARELAIPDKLSSDPALVWLPRGHHGLRGHRRHWKRARFSANNRFPSPGTGNLMC